MQKYFEKIIERLKKQKEKSAYITDGIANRRIYDNGIKNAIEIVNQVAEECKDRIFINGQCCWQSCACTEKCQECNRYTLSDADIDWYESIEDWDDEFGKDTNVGSNDGWIPCKNELPKEYTDVLGCDYDGNIYVVELYKDSIYGNVWRQWNGGLLRLGVILAWQPLPAPYQPKGEEQ